MLDIKTTIKKLSIKITLIVFVFFLLSFFVLIFLHHYKFLYEEKQNLLETVSFVKHDEKFFDNLLQNVCMGKCDKMKLITRDFLVIRGNEVVMKNGIYEMIDVEQFLENDFDNGKLTHIHFGDGKYFYVINEFYKGYNLYFTRDISFHTDYEKSLVIIFIFLSLFLSIFIYLLSLKLARISLEPLKSYNESLKLYNHHIAHELKTPLAVLKSELELLKIGYDKNTIKSSLEEVDSMTQVIDSMLFLSESIVLNEVKDININDIIEELIDFYSGKHKHTFLTKSKNIKNLYIKGDRIFLKTMFKNLFENAIKYSIDNKIDINLNKNFFEISNTYNGIIDEKSKNSLFDAFYKLNFNHDSYGLGLSIVKKIADLHGFQIELVTKNNKFSVKIYFT